MINNMTMGHRLIDFDSSMSSQSLCLGRFASHCTCSRVCVRRACGVRARGLANRVTGVRNVRTRIVTLK